MINQMGYVIQAGLRQQQKLDTIINRLANVSTTGFKADILSFDEMLKANMAIDFTQGDLQQTGNDLDLALEKEGFFKIQTQRGIRYTRNGTFTLNSEGVLVTQNGDPVLGGGRPILIQGTHIDVNASGEIRVDNQPVGKLDIVTFSSTDKLIKEGESLFVYKGFETDERASETVSLRQSALEMPNVSVVIEMTKMIEASRNYESCMKILQSFDEADGKAINDLGKI